MRRFGGGNLHIRSHDPGAPFLAAIGQEGTISGLLGNLDGEAANDIRIRDGEVIPQPNEPDPAFQLRVNGEFADSSRVSEEESLFDYVQTGF
jgi:hypothetical protein